jgi:hypothetical protein
MSGCLTGDTLINSLPDQTFGRLARLNHRVDHLRRPMSQFDGSHLSSRSDVCEEKAAAPVGKILPVELFGVMAEFLHAQRYYRTLANINAASGMLYDQTLRLLWTAVRFRTPRNVDARVAERERVEKFARILNAGGTELIQ